MTNLCKRPWWLGPFQIMALGTVLWLVPGARAQPNELVPLKASTDYGFWATFSHDKTLVAAVGDCSQVQGINRVVPRASEIKVWDVATGQLKARFAATGVDFIRAAFSPEGTLLAAPVDRATIRLWDVSTAKDLGTFAVDGDIVLAVAFSRDGKYLATGNTKDTVGLWELASGRERVLRGHRSTVFCVAFSPDGKLLASGSRDRTVRLWDLATGAERTRLREHPGAVTSVVFSSDGKYLASDSADLKQKIDQEQSVTIWDLSSGKVTARLKGCGLPAFSDDGKLLATIKEGGGILDVWNTPTAKLEFTHRLRVGATALAVTFSGDGKLLAVVKENSQLKLETSQWARR
jgi:WD40 repeat protein